MKCKWCKNGCQFEVGVLSFIIDGKGGSFYACENCLKEHGREENYEVPSPYNDLLIRLGI